MHKIICAQLDRVVRGEIDRLMLLCAPQHGKSTVASKRFPAFLLGNSPIYDIISASATSALAEEFGREVRDCVGSTAYGNVFPGTTLSEDSTAKGRWNTQQGGGYYAIGFGGSIFGRGGNLGIIDDPFASWSDAQSPTEREKVWNWYQGSFYNRIRPGGPIIVIQHRLHEEDLAGRLIAKMKEGGKADKWEIIELPALLEDPPWPERYDRAALERLKENSSPLQWASMYMQNPMPEEGTFFKREWFWRFDPRLMGRAHKYTSADFAVTAEGGDDTDIGTHGYMDGKLYLACDGWFGKTAADKWIEALIDQFQAHKPLCFFGESGQIRRAVEPFLLRRMTERKVSCRMEWLHRPHDKATMARGLQAMASMGKVGIANGEYGERVLRALLMFSGTGESKGDDPVDMAALMGMAIDQAHPSLTHQPREPEKPKDGYRPVQTDNEVKLWRVV
jgi:hypothetical protein